MEAPQLLQLHPYVSKHTPSHGETSQGIGFLVFCWFGLDWFGCFVLFAIAFHFNFE